VTRPTALSAERLWAASRWLSRRGHRRAANGLKALNFLVFGSVLPPDVEVRGEVHLLHHGLGVVINENVVFEGDASIAHHVTIGAGGVVSMKGRRVFIEHNVFIGAGAIVMARQGRTLRVGESAAIGAGAVVVDDVPPGARVAGPKAVIVSRLEAAVDDA
jgi:serine O-acetyltransferase